VNDPVLVGEIQGLGRIARDPKCFGDGQLPFPGEQTAEGLSVDVRHREPEPSGGFAGIENGQDVGMLQLGGQSNFTKEALGAEGRRELRTQDL
jgi:hypothetical protein